MISPATILRLREATDLQALAADYVTLRKSGSGWVTSCPFHKEDTPSCRIHKLFFKCFGCGRGGSALDWLMQLEGCSFPDAAKILSDRTGIPLDQRPVTRVQMQYAREEAALCKWWWARYRATLRAELEALMAEESPLAEHQWRWLAWAPGPTMAFAFFREQVTPAQRREWRAEMEDLKKWEQLWMSLAA